MTLPLGLLIRDRRIAAGFSVRALATAIGVTAVELGEVERGVHTLLLGFYGRSLVDALRNVTLEELEEAQAVEMEPEEAPAPQPALRWRREPPTVPGLYVAACDGVVFAIRAPEDGLLEFAGRWRWLGPLPEPEPAE